MLDINGLTGEAAIVAADTIPFYDATAGANRKVTLTELSVALGASDEKLKVDAAATAGYLGAASSDGVLRTEAPLTYADGGDFVTLGCDTLELIDSDTTIYLETTGNDTTGDGSSGDPWLTLSKALSYLADKSIATDATVTIQFGDGTYTRTATDTVNHPNGDRINIVGENTYDISMTSVQSSSGSAGNWSIIVNVSSVVNIAVDDFVIFPYNMAGGTRPITMCGVWKVTNVDGGNVRITVASSSSYTSAPSGAVAGTVTVLKAILQYNGVGGVIVSDKLGLIDKLCLSGNGSGNGILVDPRAGVTGGTALGVSYFSLNVYVTDQGVARLNYACLSKAATTNLRILYGLCWAFRSVNTGSSGRGIWNSTGQFDGQQSVVSGNNIYGIEADWAAWNNFYAGKSQYNIGIGVYCFGQSFTRAETATVNNNTTNFSPVGNTLGNHQAYTII